MQLEQLETRLNLNYYRDSLCTNVIALHSLTSGWVTFGQTLLPGVAYESLSLGDLPTQVDPKTFYNDGSIRFAVITAYVPQNGLYELTATSLPEYNFYTEINQNVAVHILFANDIYSAWPRSEAQNFWLFGNLMNEAQWFDTPTSDITGQPHPFLRVGFASRNYANGNHRYEVVVENTLNVQQATWANYEVGIYVNNDLLWSKTNVQHGYLSRWSKTFFVGQQGTVKPDLTPAYLVGALPEYSNLVSNYIDGGNTEILTAGVLNPFMPEHGGRPELAPYPDWTARYLVHQHDQQLGFVLSQGTLSGSWPIHWRASDGRMLSFVDRPNVWFDHEGGWRGERPLGNVFATRLTPDINHQPSLAYVPYLLTGDYYFAEELAFWANYDIMGVYPPNRAGQNLILTSETRGFAWGLRNVVDAAAYLPNDWPIKSWFWWTVQTNLAWLDNYANTHNPPLGTFWEFMRPENYDPLYWSQRWVAPWENNYVSWAVYRANVQGFAGGTEYVRRTSSLQLQLFLDPNTRNGAAPYLMPVGSRNPPGGSTVWYTDYRQTYNGPNQFAGYYGVDARISLLLGEWLNMADARLAINWLFSQPGMANDLANRSGWYVNLVLNA